MLFLTDMEFSSSDSVTVFVFVDCLNVNGSCIHDRSEYNLCFYLLFSVTILNPSGCFIL